MSCSLSATNGRFNSTVGHVGAYPTFSIHGEMSLRPVRAKRGGALMIDK